MASSFVGSGRQMGDLDDLLAVALLQGSADLPSLAGPGGLMKADDDLVTWGGARESLPARTP